MDVGSNYGVQNTETLSKCTPNIIQNEKEMIKWQCFFKKPIKRGKRNFDVKKMKIGFLVEQCTQVLFQAQNSSVK